MRYSRYSCDLVLRYGRMWTCIQNKRGGSLKGGKEVARLRILHVQQHKCDRCESIGLEKARRLQYSEHTTQLSCKVLQSMSYNRELQNVNHNSRIRDLSAHFPSDYLLYWAFSLSYVPPKFIQRLFPHRTVTADLKRQCMKSFLMVFCTQEHGKQLHGGSS